MKVSRDIIKMSKVLNDAIDEVSSQHTVEDAQEDDEDAKWPQIPCFMVGIIELRRIKVYCEHFNFNKNFDSIPIPLPSNGDKDWMSDDWESNFIGSI